MGGRGAAPSGASATASGPAGSASDVAVSAVNAAVNTSAYPYLGPGDRTVADVRDELSRRGITGRAEQDAALKAASRAGRIHISSAIAPYELTRREIEQGIMIGGQVDQIVSPR
jgi:hypothetical protein